jgi:NADPH:quinone reductase-like Zn-dependent oxidoreductase
VIDFIAVIDYTKSDPRSIIPAGSVDFILDTIGNATQYISLMMPKTGIIISIAGKPSGKTLQESSLLQRSDMPKLPWYVHLFLGVVDSVRKMRAKRWNVKHEFMILAPNAKDLDFLTDCVGAGKLKPVVGMEVNFREIEEVRRASMLAYTGKGGVGKTVIKII